MSHDIFIKGCQVNSSLDKPTDVEVASLYPEMQFKTIDECFDEFAEKMIGTEKATSKEGMAVPTSIRKLWSSLLHGPNYPAFLLELI